MDSAVRILRAVLFYSCRVGDEVAVVLSFVCLFVHWEVDVGDVFMDFAIVDEFCVVYFLGGLRRI